MHQTAKYKYLWLACVLANCSLLCLYHSSSSFLAAAFHSFFFNSSSASLYSKNWWIKQFQFREDSKCWNLFWQDAFFALPSTAALCLILWTADPRLKWPNNQWFARIYFENIKDYIWMSRFNNYVGIIIIIWGSDNVRRLIESKRLHIIFESIHFDLLLGKKFGRWIHTERIVRHHWHCGGGLIETTK